MVFHLSWVELFPCEKSGVHYFFCSFSLNFRFWAYQKQPLQTGPKPILERNAKILQHNSPPSYVSVLSFLTSGIKAGSPLKD